MTKRLAVATMFSVVLLSPTHARAQTPAAPAPPNVAPAQGQQRQQQTASQEIVLRGCLASASASESSKGATSSGGAAAAGSQFLLRVAPVAAGQNDVPSPSGTSSRAPESASQQKSGNYVLQPASEDVKLQSYVGQTIEVKGHTVTEPDTLSTPGTNAGVSTSQPSGSSGMETIPPPQGKAVLVTSVRTISSSCDAGHGY
jgi:hypothetical protein